MLNIAAVVVTYRPDPAHLLTLLTALQAQVRWVCVVDNGSSREAWPALPGGVTLIALPDNTGIAHALNCGVRQVSQYQPDYVLTMDQDSLPAPDMVAKLWQAAEQLRAEGLRVGAVGPQQQDRRSGHCAPFLAPVTGRRRGIYPPKNGTIEVDHLITSGCLTPLAVWQQVGEMLEALFIDYVDIEWSLRARALGYSLHAVESARLLHQIGDQLIHWRGRQIPLHSPLRHYYLMRNGVWLQKLAHIPWRWKISDAIQLLKKLVFFTCFAPNGRQHARMMARGLWDGVCGRGGRCPD